MSDRLCSLDRDVAELSLKEIEWRELEGSLLGGRLSEVQQVSLEASRMDLPSFEVPDDTLTRVSGVRMLWREEPDGAAGAVSVGAIVMMFREVVMVVGKKNVGVL